MNEIKEMDLESKDLVAERIEQMKALFPEIAIEGDGSIDFEKLRLILGDEVDEGDERYAFTWPGKADAIRQAQTVSAATLRPCPEESVDWDTTQNLYIEGDNLEVLKLLQRGYHGKIRMIYIDPPYNTGKDFVYKDSFGDSVENYKEQASLNNQSNADTSGRFHSDWCSMMYPRIKLARELLTSDGLMFVSIDDNEHTNLRRICDEIFGEQNFLACVTWHRNYASANDSKTFSNVVDYVLVYSKTPSFKRNLLPRTEKQNSLYKYDSNDGKGRWRSDNLSVRTYSASYDYPIINPNTGVSYNPPSGRSWITNRETMQKWIEENRVFFGQNGQGAPQLKRYLNEVQGGIVPTTYWSYEDCGHNDEARKELKALFDIPPFDSPKPTRLIEQILRIGSDKDSIILDFFSGSATSAQAIMHLNSEDGGSRRYIMVQLPEECAADANAAKAGYSNICEIGQDRIKRASRAIAKEVNESNAQLALGEEPKKLPDMGFRVLRLDDSGISRPEPGMLMLDRVKPDRTDQDIIFEMMLKWGLELTYPIEKVSISGYECYSVAGDTLICCLSNGLSVHVIQEIADMEPDRVLMLDSILDDTLKLNALQIFKRVEERTQKKIDLRTV